MIASLDLKTSSGLDQNSFLFFFCITFYLNEEEEEFDVLIFMSTWLR